MEVRKKTPVAREASPEMTPSSTVWSAESQLRSISNQPCTLSSPHSYNMVSHPIMTYVLLPSIGDWQVPISSTATISNKLVHHTPSTQSIRIQVEPREALLVERVQCVTFSGRCRASFSYVCRDACLTFEYCLLSRFRMQRPAHSSLGVLRCPIVSLLFLAVQFPGRLWHARLPHTKRLLWSRSQRESEDEGH